MVHDGAATPPGVGARPPVSRGTVHASLARAIGRLKHDSGYRIECEFPNRDLFEGRRLREAWRGQFVRRRLGQSAGVVFAGRHVTIRHGKYVTVGAWLQIGDDVLVKPHDRHVSLVIWPPRYLVSSVCLNEMPVLEDPDALQP
jgi:hypothetical protein